MTNRCVQKTVLAILGVVSMGLVSTNAFADRPAAEEYRERAPTQPAREERAAVTESDAWKVRLSPGVSIWMPSKEDNETAPAVHMDFWKAGSPWNFRVGVEGQHVDLDQEAAAPLADGPGRRPRVTFIRVPFAVEYKHDFNDRVSGYFGGGPDLDIFANDASDVTVGAHIGARLAYAFNDHWGVSVDGGYFWADFEDNDADVSLRSAYVTPLVNYTF